MDYAVRFEKVSKKYRLGLGRISVLATIGQAVRRVTRNGAGAVKNEDLWALRDASFEVKPGECLGLVGPNGAGKTTILKLLSRITNATSGVISSSGTISALIELGAGFHPDLTGRENAYLNGAILGLNRRFISSHLDEIIAFSGLEKFIDTPIKRYSSGMIVRLGFAVASSVQPEILLVDEVLAVGDASFQQKCLERIRDLVQRGTAIIFVSHNLYLVQAICGRALYVDHGRILLDGSASDVIAAYERDLHNSRIRQMEYQPCDGEPEQGELVEITSIEVLSADRRAPAEGLSSAAPALIRIRYQAAGDIDRVNASVFIRRSDGVVCCMLRTSLNGCRFTLRRGAGSICVHLEKLQLNTGTYVAQAHFLDDADCIALTASAPPSKWFFVAGAGISSAADSGVFQPSLRWSQTCDSEPGIRCKPAAKMTLQ